MAALEAFHGPMAQSSIAFKKHTAPTLRRSVPVRKTDFGPRDTPRFTADFTPGGHQAYLSPCCSVIRATPGREVR